MLRQERFRQLLSRKMAGEATPAELDELALLISENPDWQIFIEQLASDEDEDPSRDQIEAAAAFAAHAAKMQLSGRLDNIVNMPPRKSRWKMGIGIAASLLVVLAGVYFFPRTHTDPQANEVATKRGSISKVTLPDGTQVWLNSDSKLSYPGDLSGRTREVTLSGEAFFDVAKDEARPFIIHTDKINVRVLGTAFNLKSYPGDEVVETALIRGKIEVTFNDRPSENIILKPNERLVVSSGRPARPKIALDNINLMKDSVVAETAWMQNKIAFSDETLLNICHMLERRFDVRFKWDNEEVKSYTYTGIYENEGLRKILEVLSISQKFTYSIESRTVTVGK